MKHDPPERIELTRPWAGFGFQAGHMWTPEGHTLYPEDMVWWSLTCNIAREWRLMMAAARDPVSRSELPGNPCPTTVSNAGAPGGHVIYLQDVLRHRKERSAGGNDARFADRATVVRATRGPSRHRRG